MHDTRRNFLKAAGTAAAGASVLAGPAVARAQQVHRWKAQSLWSAAELTYKVFQDFCERVKKLTAGRLEITPFPAGAVTGAFETLDAVTANVLQAQSSWPGYWTGKEPGLVNGVLDCVARAIRPEELGTPTGGRSASAR